jgi:hypothetical protein
VRLAAASARGAGALLAALALAGNHAPAQAGAPFQTDDPDTVATGHYEALLFYQQTLAADGRSGVLPGLELHYGAAPNLELDLVAPIGFHAPPGKPAERGYGDTVLALKYALIRETETTPQVGFVPKLDLPTGNADRGLGSGGSAWFLPVWLQKSNGNLRTYGGGGYWVNRGSGNRNYWFVGWEAEYRLSDHWLAGAEVFHTTPQTVEQRPSTGFNVGGSYTLSDRGQLLFSFGKGLSNAKQTNRVSSYLGCQLNF